MPDPVDDELLDDELLDDDPVVSKEPPTPPLPPFVVSKVRHAGETTATSTNVMVATSRRRIIPPSENPSGTSKASAR
jgi:hypothetical protein